jgi:hypothetical protein
MRKTFSFMLLLSIASLCLRGQNVQSIIRLDTIINTGYPLETEFDKVISNVNKNELWMYIPNWNESDTVTFIKLDLNTNGYDTLSCIIPGLPYKIQSPVAEAMSISDKYVLLAFFKSIALFTRSGNRLVFDKIFPINETYSYYRINGEQVICGKAYNHHPLSEPSKTLLVVYDIKKDAFVKVLEPAFKNIEFSHFGGNHWIDASASSVLFAQTTEYSIDIYNTALESKGKIKREAKDWNSFNNAVMTRLSKKIPQGSSKVLIDSLTPYDRTVSRLEGAYFINDSMVLVRYIPQNSFTNNDYRKYDLWQLQSGKWLLVKNDLEDKKFTPAETMTKDNFYITGGSSVDMFISNGRVIIVRAGSPVDLLGKKLKDARKAEDLYYEKNNPVALVYIYKLNIK